MDKKGIAQYCPACRSSKYLHNEDGNKNNYCGQCGYPLDGDRMYNKDTRHMEEKFKCGDCVEYHSKENEAIGKCKVKDVFVSRSKSACKKHFKKIYEEEDQRWKD